MLMLSFRGYQKSIIEMELEEQRRGQGMLWQQTKESILEARGILTSSNYLTGKHRRVGPSRMTKRLLLSGDSDAPPGPGQQGGERADQASNSLGLCRDG